MGRKFKTKAEAQAEIDLAYGVGAYKVLRLITGDKKSLKVEVECLNCCSIEEYVLKYFVTKGVKCICQKPDGLEKIAKAYADEIYIETPEGAILGEELDEYIVACIKYDKPGLSDNIEFVNMVEDRILDKYEKKKIKPCKRCRKYHFNRYMEKGICVYCREGI